MQDRLVACSGLRAEEVYNSTHSCFIMVRNMQPDNQYPNPYQNPYQQPMQPVQPEQPPAPKPKPKGKLIAIFVVVLLLIGGAAVAGQLLKPSCSGDSCKQTTEEENNQNGIEINGNVVSGGNIFGLRFSNEPDAHADNLVIAKYVDDLSVKRVRYDIFLDELEYSQIDEIMGQVNDDTWVMATVRIARDNPRYPTGDKQTKYLETLKKLANRYSKDVDVWQIGTDVYSAPAKNWRGTKQQYTHILNLSYDAIKSVQPNVKVAPAGIRALGGYQSLLELPETAKVEAYTESPEILDDEALKEVTRSPNEFLAYVLKHGKFDDIVDISIYDTPESINRHVPRLREKLQEYGRTAQILVGETGSIDPAIIDTEYDIKSVSEQREIQAQELARRYVYLAHNNVLAGLWDEMYQPTSKKSSYAFVVTDDRLRLPAYHTLKLLNETLNGYTEVAKLADNQYRFAVNGQHYFVIWGKEGETADLSAYTTAVSATAFKIVTKLDDRLQPVVPPDERVSLKSIAVSPTPMLVQVDNYYDQDDFESSDNNTTQPSEESTTQQ